MPSVGPFSAASSNRRIGFGDHRLANSRAERRWGPRTIALTIANGSSPLTDCFFFPCSWSLLSALGSAVGSAR
jgi:hypothetical protein